MNIVPYTFIDAERVRFGRFPVLDTVLYRWARRIEDTLFDQARVEVYTGASVFEEMKFSTFFATLRNPRPIYFIELEPFQGMGLFVTDNRFSAFCLAHLRETAPEWEQRRDGKLSAQNHRRLQQVVQRMMGDFDQCWGDVARVRTRLKKITTYPFRARILNAYEPCFVAQIHLSGRGISSRLTWCLPRAMLEPLLGRLRQSKVIPPATHQSFAAARITQEKLLEWLRIPLQVSMGGVDLSRSDRDLQVGAVLPVDNDASGKALLQVDGRPVVVGTVGEAQGRYAVRLEKAYRPTRAFLPGSQEQFRPIDWPRATPGPL